MKETMTTQARIYAVRDTETHVDSFVKATNQPQAMRHIAKSRFHISVASSVAVADHMTAGGKILDATGPQKELDMEETK